MVIQRGEVWWASLPDPIGSGPGFRRPVLIIQADSFNESRIQTVIVAVITSNLDLSEAPGNVLIPAHTAGLKKDSVVNVSQLLTVDRTLLTECIGSLEGRMREIERGLRLVLSL